MPDELMYPADISNESLYALFDAVYMEVSYDSDGVVRVRDNVRCRVVPTAEGREIRFLAVFGFKAESPMGDRLALVNKANTSVKFACAYVDDDRLYIDYSLAVEGGITKRAIVCSARRFLRGVAAALDMDEGDILE